MKLTSLETIQETIEQLRLEDAEAQIRQDQRAREELRLQRWHDTFNAALVAIIPQVFVDSEPRQAVHYVNAAEKIADLAHGER